LSDSIALYTDGSCSAKDRIGGWAWLALDTDTPLYGSGSEDDTTISRMELKAAIHGLAELGGRYGPCSVLVFSDSQYVVKGITDRTRKRNLNGDLWDLLDEVTDTHESVVYQHVRGHSGHRYNEEVDRLAGLARKQLKEQIDARTDSRP